MDEPQNGSTQRSLNIDARSSTIHQLVGNQHNHNDGIHYHVTRSQQFDPQILEKLRPADMDPYGRPECLEGTRTSVIQFITEWAFNPDTSHNVLWIHGLAGIGKSTISSTIANRFGAMGHLGAFVFFDRDVAERSDPASVIRTLAYQVALSHPSLGKTIASVLDKYPKMHISPPILQFQRLLVEPLTSTYGQDFSPIILIIDALDECGTSKTRSALLKVFAESAANLPANVLFLVTSRPERDIMHAFGESSHILKLEFEILLDNNVDDISAFIRYQLAQMKKYTHHLASKTVWPTEAEIGQLVERASGLFVWASTALQFIDGYDPQKRLHLILSGNALNGAENALDALYRTALEAAGRWDDEDFVSDFRAVIGMILALRRPLSSTNLDLLLGSTHSSCERIISHLRCVIQREPTVRILHPSFGDFLQTPSRNLRDIWSFDDPDQKIKMAIYTLRHLCRTLRRNICNITLSAKFDGEKLSDDVTYACLFWVDHICAIENNTEAIMENLGEFIFIHLLHWFEAMSILKRTRSAIAMLDDLHDWLLTHSPPLPIVQLVSDTFTFAQTFVGTLEEHPLLVYHSALPFAPHSSAIYKAFNTNMSNSVVSCGFQHSWPSHSLVLTGHRSVEMAMFSPDGRSIASSSYSGMVRLWDAKTGAELFPPLRHSSESIPAIYYVTFSFNGLRILSVSSCGLLKMWDAMSGVEFLPSLQIDDINESRWIHKGAFSVDGMKFVWGTNDGNICVIHLDPHTQLHQLSAFYGYNLSICSVSFSPDGGRIVTGFHDGSIQVYVVGLGLELISRMRGDWERVRSVAFSSNGTRIVSLSAHARVWSVDSGLEIFSFRGDSAFTSAVFSPDSTIILSGSEDGNIRVWDAVSGVEIQDVLRRHASRINSVAFSPDGRSIVSTSNDFTIRVWKLSTDSSEYTISDVQRDCRKEIRSVALSPDGSKVASGHGNGTVSIWDAKKGTEIIQVPPLRKHEEGILSVIFSPDGTRVFSSSDDCTICAFDATTGIELFPAIQNHCIVRSIAVNPTGSQIVSGDEEGDIRLWDAKLGVEIRFLNISPIRCLGDPVDSVAFSSDGTMIVSVSYSDIKLWDANSCEMLLARLGGISWRPDTPRHMAFSLDGSILYSQRGSLVEMWSIITKEDTEDPDVTSDLDLCSRLASGIIVTKEGWLVDPKTMRTFSRLPFSLQSPNLKFQCNSKSLAIGTPDGHLYVIHISSEALQSPETRPIERNSRLHVRNHRDGALNGDSDPDSD